MSAHRCNTRARLDHALALGAAFVEFDLRREDGAVVVAHDPGEVGDLDLDAVLESLAGRAGAHLDLKLSSPGHRLEVDAVARTVAALGAERVVVTTGRDAVIRAVRDWADTEGVDLRIGLSLGGSVSHLPWRRRLARRRSELRPAARMAACGADVAVAHWAIAALGVGRWARRHGVPLLVWTVDSPRGLRRWTAPGRAWMLTTNRPEAALALVRGDVLPQ